ncbi:MAG: glycogen/starch/alpha-glucan phosphorylase [Deltaproteobacteria bacterium]|nr:glycogen/starch/alpha-glucan phosphorylase [Deltaproteobacteria bacterium]
MDAEAIRRSFAEHIEYTQARDEHTVTGRDFFRAMARTTRDRMVDRWNKTQQSYYHDDRRRVYYLSMEFLMGRLLRDSLINLGALSTGKEALDQLDVDLEEVLAPEPDAGLGNGGLGRLAACFLDSMATLKLPAMGYGIRYEYGIFKQIIEDGAQMEAPDNWLRCGNPWELPRHDEVFPVRFYGQVQTEQRDGTLVVEWVGTEVVMAMAYDMLVPGYRNDTVNTLRLWGAKASREFDFNNFNRGDYILAVHEKNDTENISRVLYPNDNISQGRELRLKQEYFFVSASLQDAIRRHLKLHQSVRNLHEKAVFQLNDTHPALAVAELMRLLMDEHHLGWGESWHITTHAMAYTNHTVLPEALEQWPVSLLERVLPRHLEIIYEINARFLDEVKRRFPGDDARVRRMSLVEEGPPKRIRMAHLAIVGSMSVNGVSALHSQLLVDRIFTDFAEMYPGKFNNKTNGITPRRWLLNCNPELSELVTARVGDGWAKDLNRLERLARRPDDAALQAAIHAVKHANKLRLVELVKQDVGLTVDPSSLFDVQVKRIHEYKRQLMNLLHVWVRYRRILREGVGDAPPRTVFFAGKAAPGYATAKHTIRLIHAVAEVVNHDPRTRDWLKVVFIPDYRVSLAEIIIPAAELSEQISTAGYEASGTGNMKFSLNGALTIGTMDGANIEIAEAVGKENMFIFGLEEPGVVELKRRGYDPRKAMEADTELRDAIESMQVQFSQLPAARALYSALFRGGDPFLVLADFPAYRDRQRDVDAAYLKPAVWDRMSILNVANMGRFSSDETIRHYAEDIWKV